MSLGLRLAGWISLLLALPLAFLAWSHPANEYRATLGMAALDCDGPFGTYLLAAPPLLIYGAALVLNGRRWRRPLNLAVAVLSLVICALVMANVARAVAEERRQAAECR